MLVAVAVALASALCAPFSDVHGRFTLELPPGWAFAPMPGDVDGATFRRVVDGLPANAAVRVLMVGEGQSLEQLAADWAAAQMRQSGMRLVEEAPTTLGGLPALRRRVVQELGDTKKTAKMIEDVLAYAQGRFFVVHVETLAEFFPSFEDDFAALVASFSPKGLRASPVALVESPLVGRWLMVDDRTSVLELRADGSLELAGHKGTFALDGGVLVTRLADGAEERFTWTMPSAEELVLSGAGLDAELRYRRAKAQKSRSESGKKKRK